MGNSAKTSLSSLDVALSELGGHRMLNLQCDLPEKVEMGLQIPPIGDSQTGISLELTFLVQGTTNKVLLDSEILLEQRPLRDKHVKPFVYYDFHSQRNGEGFVSVHDEDSWSKKSYFETLTRIPADELGLAYMPRLLEESPFAPENTPIYKLRRQLLDYFEKWHFYNANHMDLNAIRNSEPKLGGTDTLLSASAENLALVIFNLTNESVIFEEQINNAMRLIFPDSRRLRAILSGRLNLTLEWYFDSVSATQPLYLNELSDGTVRMLCWAVLLNSPHLPSLLVIDEPELGLHPAWLKILAAWIIQTAQHTQVIITTHSPDLLDYFTEHLEKIIVFERTAAGYQPVHLQREKLAELLAAGWEVGDMYRVGEPSIGGWPW